MQRLRKHTTGKSCLQLKRLGDVDQCILEELLGASITSGALTGSGSRRGKRVSLSTPAETHDRRCWSELPGRRTGRGAIEAAAR